MRLFIAIELPEQLRHQLALLQYPAKEIRWSREEQLHLTLAFLDKQPSSLMEPLCQALSTIEFSPFELTTQDMGCFKGGALWLGLEASSPLKNLQQKICRAVTQTGIPLESRRYHPHLTLGRSKNNPATAVEELQYQLNQQRFSFNVDRFVLKSSRLYQHGAEHQVEAEFIVDRH